MKQQAQGIGRCADGLERGILPETPVENLQAVDDMVSEFSARSKAR